ncbi:ABC transporter substrate-binding protein [Chthonobacter albigriseus]|uniref:ABC transporter substrate-binding protein n=1 Tax=Chthonobacter albigriseus TaxID=1683161 RepID=UPI0015EFA731|nr:ABC transporter substrate-binding protein [Chthonobacter albigriseus]
MTGKLFSTTRRGIAGILVAAALASTSLFGTVGKASAETTLTIGIEADLAKLDPHISGTWNTFKALSHVYEGFVAEDLLVADVPAPPIVPALAESWTISEDKLTYTFKLRQGVKFHDGTDFNAAAVDFNMKRMLDPSFQFHQPGAVGMMQWVWGDVASYKVVDDYTYEIKLKQPNSELLRRMAAGGSGTPRFISPAAVEKYGNDGINANAVGTGPFMLTERVVGEKAVLTKNASYWDPKRTPKVDKLILRGIPEVATRELGLMTGELDMIATPSPDSIEYLEAQGLTVFKGPAATVYPIWLNFKEKPLQDVRVRKAMAMAIDREGMAKFLRRGMAVPAYGILNFGGPGWDPEYRDFPYDPEGAKKLLAEAGYPDGFETRLDWTMGGGGDVNTRADAEWIQRDLARIGIKATIEVFDNGTYWDMLAKGIREGSCCMQVSWGETGFFWLDLVLTKAAMPPNGFNSGYYDNPKMDELLAKARSAASEEEMIKTLHEVRDIVTADAAFIPVYTPIQVYVTRPNVKGFVLAPQHWADSPGVNRE